MVWKGWRRITVYASPSAWSTNSCIFPDIVCVPNPVLMVINDSFSLGQKGYSRGAICPTTRVELHEAAGGDTKQLLLSRTEGIWGILAWMGLIEVGSGIEIKHPSLAWRLSKWSRIASRLSKTFDLKIKCRSCEK